MIPILTGLGYAALAVTAFVACCSLLVPTNAASYLIRSLMGNLHWGECNPDSHCSNWKSDYDCFTMKESLKACIEEDTTYANCDCLDRDEICRKHGFEAHVYTKQMVGFCVHKHYCRQGQGEGPCWSVLKWVTYGSHSQNYTTYRRQFNDVVKDHFLHNVISPAELCYGNDIMVRRVLT